MNKLSWILVAATGLLAAAWAAMAGFAVAGFGPPLVALAAVGAAAGYFRHEERFVLCLSALAQIVLFSTAFVVLTYLGARSAATLIDKQLMAADAFLGFHSPSLVAWTRDHAWLDRLLGCIYATMLPQTALVVAVLGLRHDRPALETYVLRMMLGGLAVFAFFMAIPAEGPFAAYGFPASADQAHYLSDLRALRSGTLTGMDFGSVDGLITFPSFHTIWAILLTLAFRNPIARTLSALLNSAVILATLTTGWHYLTDVLAGALICVVICLATRPLERRLRIP